jgi:hypothetical protein
MSRTNHNISDHINKSTTKHTIVFTKLFLLFYTSFTSIVLCVNNYHKISLKIIQIYSLTTVGHQWIRLWYRRWDSPR